MANHTKLTVDAQEGTSMLFFLNEGNYERFQDMGLFPKEKEACVKVRDCEGFRQMGSPASIQDMQACLRLLPEDSKMAEDEEKLAYYAASERLLKEFIGK